MEKVIHCRDLGFDCNGVVKTNTKEEVKALAAEHAKTEHGVDNITPEIDEKMDAVIQEE